MEKLSKAQKGVTCKKVESEKSEEKRYTSVADTKGKRKGLERGQVVVG